VKVVQFNQQSGVTARNNSLAPTQNVFLRPFDINLDKVHPLVSARPKIIERNGLDRYALLAQLRYGRCAPRKRLLVVSLNRKF
jgi:hypothetical protein